ncbi:protein CutA homolog [Xyrauchen texanus]|uniref:protein CutA homolog n=1 Tax=Xyrauchen texanus TaxID=154827 RepID=UPI002242798C|nr:protein CutA homolog [Xyrauchen texanus]
MELQRRKKVIHTWDGMRTLVLTLALCPMLRTLRVQIHSAVSTGSYMAGYHSVMLINCPTEQIARDIGRAVHPYDIPEIISFPIDDGSLHYLKWMEDVLPDI